MTTGKLEAGEGAVVGVVNDCRRGDSEEVCDLADG